MIIPITAEHPGPAQATPTATQEAARTIPLIGHVGAGGVVTLNAGALEWLDAVQRRLAAERAAAPA